MKALGVRYLKANSWYLVLGSLYFFASVEISAVNGVTSTEYKEKSTKYKEQGTKYQEQYSINRQLIPDSRFQEV